MAWAMLAVFLFLSSHTYAQKLKAPVVVPPSGFWDGIDGSWSTFNVTLSIQGSKEVFRVLPAPSQSFVSVPLKEGCDPYPEMSNCAFSRGGTLDYGESIQQWYYHNATYQIEKLAQLGLNSSGSYGWTKVGLSKNSSKEQVVGQFSSSGSWLGAMGIDPFPSYFLDPKELKTIGPPFYNSTTGITSPEAQSWSYTAGAINRPGSPLGSLILGGYDEGLVDHSNGQPASYVMADDDATSKLKIWLGEVSFFSGIFKMTSTQPDIRIPIEPLTAQMWLPLSLCSIFESEFGLIYDAQMNLYFINETQHDLVLGRNLTVTFSVERDANQFSPSTLPKSTFITFPYTDFVHNASYPFVPTPRRYFPLRRAANKTQYALGRAFMQGAYLIADYGSKKFNISQVRTKKDVLGETNIVKSPMESSALYDSKNSAAKNSTDQANNKNSGRSVSANVVVGIVLPCVAILVAIIGLFQWFRIKKRRRMELSSSKDVVVDKRVSNDEQDPFHFHAKAELDGKPTLPPEADSEDIKEMDALQAPNELEHKKFGYELPAEVPGELYGDLPALELDARRKKDKLKDKRDHEKDGEVEGEIVKVKVVKLDLVTEETSTTASSQEDVATDDQTPTTIKNNQNGG